jgi:plastocyanin
MSIRPLVAALVVVAATAAAACGGSSESSEPVATTEVAMVKSYRFDPKTIEIDAGQTVTWRNEDNFTHTVQVDGRTTRSSPARASRSRSTRPVRTTTCAGSTAATWTET